MQKYAEFHLHGMERIENKSDSATVKPVNKAFEIANNGGAHAGMLKNIRANMGVVQLQAGIKKITRTISDHEGWIADPFSKPGVSDCPAEDVARWVNEKWPSDIQRLTEQRSIYEAVLKEKLK